MTALHPNSSARSWEMAGCAELAITGETVMAVRRRVALLASARDLEGAIVFRTA